MGMVDKEAQSAIETIWKQVMDPVLGYCEVCGLLHLPAIGLPIHMDVDLCSFGS